VKNISRHISLVLHLSIAILISLSACNETSSEGKSRKADSQRGDLLDGKDTKSKSSAKEKPRVIFVELGSVNCIPCRMMQPIMEEIKNEYRGQVRVVFYDVNTNAGRIWAIHYEIRVIPTQVFLDKNGEEFFRHEGFFPKDEIVKILRKKGVR
jgi:thioredoxin 1